MSRLTQNAIEGLVAALLFALAITIAEQAERQISDQRYSDEASEANPLTRRTGLH
jgi:hypothetical protein